MDKLKITLTLERETKGTYRYKEDEVEGQPPAIGTLYLRKYATGKTPPKKVIVMVRAV